MKLWKIRNDQGLTITNDRFLAFQLGARFSLIDRIINWLLGYSKK